MTDTLPNLKELLEPVDNHRLLRETVTRALEPGPWEHKVEDDFGTMRCGKCRAQILTPLSYEETGEGLNSDCPVPDPATGSLPEIDEALMTKTSWALLAPVIVERFRSTDGAPSDRADKAFAWFICAPAAIRICCRLVALQKARME